MGITGFCFFQLLRLTTAVSEQPVQLPEVGLGVAGGLDGDVDGTQTAVEQWLRLGGRHVDTALMYHNGQGVREGMRRSGVPRSEVFLTSKIPPERMGYEETLRAVADALDELGVAAIDCMLIHWPGRQWAIRSSDPPCVIDRGPGKPGDWTECRHQSWVALRKAQVDGSIRIIGVSNYELAHLAEFSPQQYPQVLQVEFHPWWFRRDLLTWCQANGVKMVAYSSLGGPGQAAGMASDTTLAALASRHSVSVSQVLLHWAITQGVAVIPSARSEAHMRDNLNCCRAWQLSPQDVAELSSMPRSMQQRTIHPDPRFIFSAKFHAGDPGPMPLTVASMNLFGAVDTMTWLSAGETSCWQGPYQHYPCCAADFGPEGLKDCWSGEFSFARCCVTTSPQWSLITVGSPGNKARIADFIVVGAGSAGSVAAGRLAAKGFTVALLDSGDWDTTALYAKHPNPSDPAQASRWFTTTVSWPLGGVKRELQVITGRVLGGSSALNGHIYTRTPLPFASTLVQSAYEAVEAELTLQYAGADVIRTDGQERVQATFSTGASSTPEAARPHLQLGERLLLAAFSAAGVPHIHHGLSSLLRGIGPLLRIVGCGGRWGASSAYHCSAKPFTAVGSGERMQVLPGHHADQLLMDGSRAVGVRVLVKDSDTQAGAEVRSVLARKEVLLAAGALSTPLLLARSGIAPEADLRRIGVPAFVHNEHVGFNLQDHPYLAFRVSTGLPCNTSLARPQDLFAFYSSLRFHDTENVQDLEMPPEVELQLSPSCVPQTGLSSHRSQGTLRYKAYLILLLSKTPARVFPRSSHALDPPQVFFDPFEGAGQDAMTLLRHVQDLYRLLRRMQSEVSFEPSESVVLDEHAAPRWCAETMGLWQHPGGTAQVGHVLNDRFQVVGTEGLRVADASSIASPQGHPDAAIRAVGHIVANWAAAEAAQA